MSFKPIDRRTVLRGFGSIAIGLPLLEIMSRGGRRALAASPPAGPVKRYIGLMIPNGVPPTTWFPTGGETDFTVGASMKKLAGSDLPALEELRQDLIVFKGIDNVASMNSFEKPGSGGGHESGPNTLFTGAPVKGIKDTRSSWQPAGPSIDQLIAAQFEKDRGAPFPIKSLLLGHSGGGADWFGSFSVDTNKTILSVTNSTSAVFDKLFGAANLNDAEREAIRKRRKSVLDGTLRGYQRLQARASAADKLRLQQHIDAIRDVELRIAAAVTCTKPDKTRFADLSPGAGEGKNLPPWSALMFDLITLAFACDATRVATFCYRNCGGGGSYMPFLGWPDAAGLNGAAADKAYADGEHHEMSHRVGQAAWDPELTKACAFFNGSTALLAKKLKAVTEGAGTLFDGTLMLQGSDCATGGHNQNDTPFVIVGNAGGAIRTGRYLRFSKSVPHNDLLLGVLKAMGVNATTIGDPALCSGPLSALT